MGAGQAAFADCRAVGGAAVEQSLAIGTERKGRQRWPFAGHKRQSLRSRETSAAVYRRRGLKRRRSGNGLDSSAGKPIRATLGLSMSREMTIFAKR